MGMTFPPPENSDPYNQPDDRGGLSGLGEDWESALPWNTPEFEQQAQPQRRQKKPQGKRSSRPLPSLPWKPILAVVALVAIIGGGFFGLQGLLGGNSNDKPTTSKSGPEYPPLSRPAPPGWTRDVAWRTEAALQSNVAVDHGHIAYLTTSGLLIIHDATTGKTVYSSTPTGLSKNAEVSITSTPTPVVAAWDSEKLLAWPLLNKGDVGKPVENPLPDGAAVTDNGGGVVAAATGNEAWALRDDLRLHKVALPAGQVPLAMTADGQIIAAPSNGRWSVINPNGKPTPVRYKMADKARGDAMYPAWSANGVVVAWAPTKDDQTRAVAFYDAVTGKTLAQTTLPTAQVNLGLPLAVTPDGQLAAAGPLLANLTTGKTIVVDDWATTIATEGALYGKDSTDTRYVWTGDPKNPTALDADTAIPWGIHQNLAIVTDQGSSRGLLIAAIKRED